MMEKREIERKRLRTEQVKLQKIREMFREIPLEKKSEQENEKNVPVVEQEEQAVVVEDRGLLQVHQVAHPAIIHQQI